MRVLSSAFLSLVILGCGDDGATTPDAAPDAPSETLGPAPALAMACSDSLADVYNLPSGLPTMDDSHRGDVFRCAPTESLSTFKVNKQIDAYNIGFNGTVEGKATSGFWSYRIAYRSERNTVGAARAEGDTAAFLLVPEKPLAGAPLIVFGHGSAGLASQCAPTHLDLAGPVQDQDYPPMLYRLAGAGYTVIAPDYNGFAYGQPSGYFNAEDEAHAVLDATRAAGKILTAPPSKVAFVGHSQGGHAVLSAQSYAESYGLQGTLVGVATLAPFWVSMSLFGAATTSTAGLTTATDTNTILYAMGYAYAAGELREGTGHGVDVFATAKQTAAKDVMFGAVCYDAVKMQALGATPDQFFDANYVNGVGMACALGGQCDAPNNLAVKWKARWIEDRPVIDTTGAPILAIYGGMDTFITPGRAQCGRRKFATDLMAVGSTTAIQYCFNSAAAHRDLPRTADPDYIMSWINAKAGIGAEPAACTDFPTGVICGAPPQDY